jgi:hypothetical protein
MAKKSTTPPPQVVRDGASATPTTQPSSVPITGSIISAREITCHRSGRAADESDAQQYVQPSLFGVGGVGRGLTIGDSHFSSVLNTVCPIRPGPTAR